MDQIKRAFQNVKEDIDSLKDEIFDIRKELSEIQFSLLQMNKIYSSLNNKIDQVFFKKSSFLSSSTDIPTDNSTHNSTEFPHFSTFRHKIKTEDDIPTDNSTHKYTFQGLKNENIDNSTRNEGVSTDRQTDRQTDNSTRNEGVNTQKTNFEQSAIFNELDKLKNSLKFNIKSLTNQEFLVLSTIYQFEEQGEIIDYIFLSKKLSLSESSIRDYVQRIINKKIPLVKERLNNKKILLHISEDLRRLSSLNTLIALRNKNIRYNE